MKRFAVKIAAELELFRDRIRRKHWTEKYGRGECIGAAHALSGMLHSAARELDVPVVELERLGAERFRAIIPKCYDCDAPAARGAYQCDSCRAQTDFTRYPE